MVFRCSVVSMSWDWGGWGGEKKASMPKRARSSALAMKLSTYRSVGSDPAGDVVLTCVAGCEAEGGTHVDLRVGVGMERLGLAMMEMLKEGFDSCAQWMLWK